jgi:hypothetical protein
MKFCPKLSSLKMVYAFANFLSSLTPLWFNLWLQLTVIVNWCPESDNDFQSEVVVVTEREKFSVPVVCHGLRG